MIFWVLISVLLAFDSSRSCDTDGPNNKLLLSLNENLLQSLNIEGVPNPSVHLALRLSNCHDLAKEKQHLKKLESYCSNELQNLVSNNKAGVGQLALFTLALRSSCVKPNTVSITVSENTETLLTHLKRQMEQERDHIVENKRPLTNYYQYSLGIVALCSSGIIVNSHVANKLIKAVNHPHLTLGGTDSVDTYAMAGMALQCVKDSGFDENTAQMESALGKIEQKLLDSRGTDHHIGNQFSTGLAVQALIAMGSPHAEFAASIQAMRTDARHNVYQHPMAISQVLPALHHKSYLNVKDLQCHNEEGGLVLEPQDPLLVLQRKTEVHDPVDPRLVLPRETEVAVKVDVVMASGSKHCYKVDVPQGSTLLTALELLMKSNGDFSFDTEDTIWGPFLSVINGERARQSDRRFWHLSTKSHALTVGIGEFTIQKAQEFTIKNTLY